MNKRDYKTIAITTIVCLIPIIFGLFVYHDLPEQIAIHWGANGEANGFAPKIVGVIVLPLALAGVNVILQLFVYNDPKRMNISKKMASLTIWTVPVIAIVLQPITLLIALGVDIRVEVISPLIVGALLVVLGNYMPKCKSNYTVGIRLPWTLADEENWKKTHHLAGFVYVVVGLVMIFNTMINVVNWVYLIIIIAAAMIFIPGIYSFIFYKNKQKNK